MAGLLDQYGGMRLSDLPMNRRRSVMDGYQEPRLSSLLDPADDALQSPSVLGGLLSLDPTDYIGPQTLGKLAMGAKALAGPAMLGGLLAMGRNGASVPSRMRQSGGILSREIDEARSAVEAAMRPPINLSNGTEVAVDFARSGGQPIMQYGSPVMNYRATNPTIFGAYAGNQFLPHSVRNDAVFRGVPREELDQVAAAQGEMANAKSTLRDLIDARDYVKQQSATQPPKQTPSRSAQHADAAWWEKTLNDKQAPVIESFLDGLRGNQAAFKLPLNSQSKNIEDIAAHFSKKTKEPITPEWRGDTLRLKNKSGEYIDIYNATSESPVVRSLDANSQGKESGMGKEFYQVALNWMANNGKTQMPDSGLSPINQLRKTGNALAGQVRSGSPIVHMNTDRLEGITSNADLLRAEAKEAAQRMPTLKGLLSFDGEKFTKTDAEIAAAIKAKDPKFSKGIGPMTAKRAALARWLSKASRADAEEAAKRWGGGLLFPAVAGAAVSPYLSGEASID